MIQMRRVQCNEVKYQWRRIEQNATNMWYHKYEDMQICIKSSDIEEKDAK